MFCALACFGDYNGSLRSLSSKQYEIIRKAKVKACSMVGKIYNISSEELVNIRKNAAQLYWQSIRGTQEYFNRIEKLRINKMSVSGKARMSKRMKQFNDTYSFEKRSIASKKGWASKTEEDIKAISMKHAINGKDFWKNASDDVKNKIKQSMIDANSKKVKCINTGIIYSSLTNAEKELGICRASIRKSIKTGLPVTKNKLVFMLI